jgi:hypothetical protein
MSKKTAKPTKTAKAAKSSADAARDKRNGITRPGEGTMCARVWSSLDKLKADGKELTFEAVRELAGKEMADATIRTQRQRWNVFNG